MKICDELICKIPKNAVHNSILLLGNKNELITDQWSIEERDGVFKNDISSRIEKCRASMIIAICSGDEND